MQILVEINGLTAAEKGVHTEELVADISAEVSEFSKHVGAVQSELHKKSAPEGAQGEFELIQFLIEVAKEPAAIKAYINMFIYAINEIMSAKGRSKEGETEQSNVSKLKIGKREILLPASVAVIKQFIEEVIKDE